MEWNVNKRIVIIDVTDTITGEVLQHEEKIYNYNRLSDRSSFILAVAKFYDRHFYGDRRCECLTITFPDTSKNDSFSINFLEQ